MIGGGLSHLQLNHNVKCPTDNDPLAACTLNHLPGLRRSRCYSAAALQKEDDHNVDLYMCENGLISINRH